MKQYLKMKDLFPLGAVSKAGFFNINSDGDVVVDIECISFHATTEEASNYVTHAINSHDELVQMNQELLAALEGVIDYLTFEGFGGRFNSIKEDVDLTDGIKPFIDVIAKAKGGEA